MEYRLKEKTTVRAVQIPEGGLFRIEDYNSDYGSDIVEGGEWLIFHNDGTFDVMTDDDFKEKYEPVVTETGPINREPIITFWHPPTER